MGIREFPENIRRGEKGLPLEAKVCWLDQDIQQGELSCVEEED